MKSSSPNQTRAGLELGAPIPQTSPLTGGDSALTSLAKLQHLNKILLMQQHSKSVSFHSSVELKPNFETSELRPSISSKGCFVSQEPAK